MTNPNEKPEILESKAPDAVDEKAVDDALASLLEDSGAVRPTIEEHQDEPSDGTGTTTTESEANTVSDSEAQPTPDVSQSTEEPKTRPLADRLSEFEREPETKPEAETPRGQLKTFELQLKQQEQALQQDFLADLPKDGIYAKDGTSIYALTQQQLNDYIIELQDKGQALAAGHVQTKYLEAVRRAENYNTGLTQYQENVQKLKQATDHVDWQEIRQEVATKLPEITDKDYEALGQYIDQQAQKDPLYYAALQTKEGKLQKGVDALNTLGILKRLKEAVKTEPEPTPENPDARRTRRVSTKPQGGELSYNPNVDIKSLKPDELDALLAFELKNCMPR